MASDWNTLMEHMAAAPLSKREGQVVAFIARKTIGYRKTGDRLSALQIAQGTGIARRHVGAALDALEGRGIITRNVRGRGRTPLIALVLDRPWRDAERAPVGGHLVAPVGGQLREARRAQRAPVGGQEVAPVPVHTREKGVKHSGLRPAADTLQRRAFDAYLAAGGTLELVAERGALARQATALVKAGEPETLILAACRDLGQRREFPGHLKQRVAELKANGGPCRWEGLNRRALLPAQLGECGCNRCREWADALSTVAAETGAAV